jgi:hypothetical protein
MKRYSFLSFLFILSFASCGTKTLAPNQIKWLIGDWNIDDGRGLESWQNHGDTLVGRVFSNREKKYSEGLKIYVDPEKNLIYEATVYDQNGGRPIRFELDYSNGDSLHFVKMQHDFPNCIDYKRLTDTSIFCHVYDKKGEGFVYTMFKIKSNN